MLTGPTPKVIVEYDAKRKKKPITRIAKAVRLSRPTIYDVLAANPC
ncbi:MAG TPA: hypothetical protein VGI40_13150 [Pirellulaceae bacterium]